MRGALRLRRARDQIGHTVHRRLQNIAHEVGYPGTARRFRVKINNKRRDNSGLVLTAMSREQDFERLEQRWRLPGAFQKVANLLLVPIRHCGNDRLLVLEVTIDQTDADTRLRTDIVHAGLVKSAFGKADQSGIKDLGTSIGNGICLGLRHNSWKMNERSFIVKS